MLPPATSADPPAAPGAVGGRSAPAAMHGPVPGFVLGGDSRKLESMLQSDRAEALLLLARFLCEEAAGRDAARREHAGLYLVQQLDEPVCTGAGGDGGKGQTASAAQSWLGVGAEQRGEIKGLLLGALGSSAPRVRNAAATAVARVGSIELEGGDEPFWPELLPTLAQRAESPRFALLAVTARLWRDEVERRAALEKLHAQIQLQLKLEHEGECGGGSGGGGAGTVSATDGEADGERQSDAALGAIRRLFDRDDAKLEGVLHDAELVERLALAILSNVRPAREDGGAGGGGGEGEDEGEDPAATALVLVLVEAETLWSAPEPVRPEVARALVLAAVCPSVPGHVRRKAFTVLGACADWLEGSHVDALWRATAPCVHADADAETAGLGAMSFWCDLAEHEEDTEAADGGHIARHQAQLLPVILGAMLLQQEGVNDDDLTLSQCASLALRHVQAVVGCGRVLEVVAPFVRAGINEAGNWRKREAAAMALGVSVETGEDAAKALLAETLAALLQCADNDSHAVVQDSAIWALGSACKAQPGLMLAQLAPLMSAMERGLRDAATSSHIAERWCAVAVALAELAEGELALDAKAQLSPYVQQLCTALLVVCQRLDYPGAVLTGASEAIAAVVVNAAAKSIGFIEGPLFLMVNEWLASAVASVDRDLKGGDEGGPESGEKRHESHEAVASACGVVSSLASRLGSEEDGTPRVYLVVPKPAEGGGARGPADIKRAAIVPPPEWKHWTVTVGLQRRALEQPHTVAHEEALLALGAIATALGRQFERCNMGVKGLSSFIASCSTAAEKLRLQRRPGDPPTPARTIAVDGYGLLLKLYHADWLHGGQFAELREECKRFVTAWHEAGFELVFIFDGGFDDVKRKEWVQRRRRDQKSVGKVFTYLKAGSGGGGPGGWSAPFPSRTDERRLRVLPVSLSHHLRGSLKSLGCRVYNSIGEADGALAAFCARHRCYGVLGQDSDFVVLRVTRYLSLETCRVGKAAIDVVSYSADRVARALGLPPAA
eukprot:g4564.t1